MLMVCVVQASAPAPPPLLQCVASFAASHKLAPLLAEQPALLEAAISVLAAPHASAASRDASLAILESLLDQEQPLQEAVLQQHTAHLLQSLQALVTAAAGSKGCALPRALKAKPKVLLTMAHSCPSHSHQQHFKGSEQVCAIFYCQCMLKALHIRQFMCKRVPDDLPPSYQVIVSPALI